MKNTANKIACHEVLSLPDDLPAVFISAGQARDFIRQVVPDETLWPELSESSEWAGHLHRVTLAVAVSELPDDEEVDIVPLYIARRIEEPNYVARRHGRTEPERLRTDVLNELKWTRLDIRDVSNLGISGLARALGYGGSQQGI